MDESKFQLEFLNSGFSAYEGSLIIVVRGNKKKTIFAKLGFMSHLAALLAIHSKFYADRMDSALGRLI